MSTTISFGGESPLLEQLRQMFGQAGADVKLDWEIGDSAGRGALWIDRRSGLTVGTDQTQDLELRMSIDTGQGQPGSAMDLDMAIEQRLRVDLLD